MKNILVLHGPNLNLLGLRETSIYGHQSLSALNDSLQSKAISVGYTIQTLQSNSESELIDAIHQADASSIDYLIFNPAALTHTSIALRDALLATRLPFIEVHMSNIYAREAFRHHSYLSDIAKGVISGFGTQSYLLALDAIITEFN